jgi:hypothetical protein
MFAIALGAFTLAAAAGLINLLGHGQYTVALIALFAGIAILASMASLEIALLCLCVLSFTDGMLKGLDPTGMSVFAKDLFLGLALVRWGWLNLVRGDWSSLRIPLVYPAVLFIVYCTAQVVNTTTLSSVVALAGLRSWIVWIPVAFLAYYTIRHQWHVQWLLIVLLTLSVSTSIYGIVQYHIGFDHLFQLGSGFAFYNRFGWDEQTVRATSTFVSPGTFGAAMSLMVIIALGALWYLQNWPGKALALLTAAAGVVGLGTSGSRAPLLAAAVGGVAMLLLVRRPRVVWTVAIVVLLGVLMVTTLASGAFARRYNLRMLNAPLIIHRIMLPFSRGFQSALDHPLGTGVATGVGLGRAANIVQETEGNLEVAQESWGMVENEYGRALRELGIPGATLFIALLLTALHGGLVACRKCRTTAFLTLAAASTGAMVCTLAQLTGGSALYLAPGGSLFYLSYALAMRLPELEAVALNRQAEEATEQQAVAAGSRPVSRLYVRRLRHGL